MDHNSIDKYKSQPFVEKRYFWCKSSAQDRTSCLVLDRVLVVLVRLYGRRKINCTEKRMSKIKYGVLHETKKRERKSRGYFTSSLQVESILQLFQSLAQRCSVSLTFTSILKPLVYLVESHMIARRQRRTIIPDRLTIEKYFLKEQVDWNKEKKKLQLFSIHNLLD